MEGDKMTNAYMVEVHLTRAALPSVYEQARIQEESLGIFERELGPDVACIKEDVLYAPVPDEETAKGLVSKMSTYLLAKYYPIQSQQEPRTEIRHPGVDAIIPI